MYPYPSNMTGVFDLASWANIVTGGWFWTFILFALFVILFMSLKIYSTERAFGASSFIISIIAIMLYSIGLLKNSLILIVAIVIGAGGLVALWATNHKEYG